ncbi:MAG TPA: metallophosphoesterase [Polyangia bacterium]|nr:metallophosphoesterase [Polyangia bacterium]
MRICHLSDLHLPLPGPVPRRALLGKRALGLANLRLRRSDTHRLEPFVELLDAVVAEDADLVLIAGDVSNLSLEAEFARVDRLLRERGLAPARTLVLPGNHDRYTPLADLGDAFERGLASWLPVGFRRRFDYPLTRRVGNVVVFGLDTAVWRGPHRAAGRLDPRQLERLADALGRLPADGPWPVIAMHHPPFELEGAFARHYRNGLDGFDALFDAIGDRGATVLHGHLHKALRRRRGAIDIIGVPSASADVDGEHRLAYHVLEFGAGGLVRAERVRHRPGGIDRFEREEIPGA